VTIEGHAEWIPETPGHPLQPCAVRTATGDLCRPNTVRRQAVARPSQPNRRSSCLSRHTTSRHWRMRFPSFGREVARFRRDRDGESATEPPTNHPRRDHARISTSRVQTT
jgi:hypothetical protein